MMGDDMAIRSGGMYGNPESRYTIANPNVAKFGSGSSLSIFGRVVGAGLGITSAFTGYDAEKEQIAVNLETLRKEKEYNIANFQQRIADTIAKNKASFYASGLDFTGTAKDVTLENRRALSEDLRIMTYNYNMQEKSLKQRQKAARGNLVAGIASSVLSAF